MKRLVVVFLGVLLWSVTAEAQTTIYWKKDFITDDRGVTIATATPVPADTTAPSAPSGVGYTSLTMTSVTISWSTTTDTGGSGLAGYKIYRARGTGVSIPVGAVSSSATSFQDPTLQPLTSYTYKVVAYDYAGNHSSTNGSASVLTLADTSYCNPGGKGNRTSSVPTISTSWALFNAFNGNVPSLVNGNRSAENSVYFYGGSVANAWVQFDFGTAKIIDEAKYYQQNSTSEATWKWQGSNNASTWSDIGGSFTLGGTDIQTIMTLTGNTTSYRYYRLRGVSGSTSNNPKVYEFEFKVDGGTGCSTPPPVTTSYSNPGGSGDRTASITTAVSWAVFNYFGSSHQGLVNGNLTEHADYFYSNSSVYDRTIQFDFGTARVIDEVKYYQSNSTNEATWKWQGSNDAVAWDDIGGSFTLGGTTVQTQTSLNGNTYSYRYYRLLGLSGSTSTSPWVYEFEFKIDAGS